MKDLVDFYTARLDEDERVARDGDGSLGQAHGDWSVKSDGVGFLKVVAERFYTVVSGVPEDTAPHIARHDPARVLREVAAKRDLIALYKEAWAAIGKGPVAVMAAAVVRRDTLHRAVAALAAVWSDHPDYREEWRHA